MGDISLSVIILQIVMAALCVVLPLGAALVGTIKMKGSAKSLLWGLLAFLAAWIVYSILWALVITIFNIPKYNVLSQGGQKDVVITWESIRCLLEAVIYTGGMWLFMRIAVKKHRTVGDGLLFGVGFDIPGSIVITAVTTILSLIVIFTSQSDHPIEFSFFSTAVNVQNLEWARWKDVVYNICTQTSLLIVTVSAGVLVYTAVVFRRVVCVAVAVVLYMASQLPSRMCALTNQYRTYGLDKIWFWDNELVVVMVSLLVALISALTAYSLYRKYLRNQSEPLL